MTNARDRLNAFISHPTDEHAETFEELVDALMAEVRTAALREAADEVQAAFHGYPYLNYPPDFADHLRRMADITQDEWTHTRDAERAEYQTP